MRHDRKNWHPIAALGSAILDFGLVAGVLAVATGLIG